CARNDKQKSPTDFCHCDIVSEGWRTGQMSKYKFPASTPRRMYWSHEVNDRSHCPECRSRLESESHSFMMAVRKGSDIQPFIVGNDAAYFCSTCPVVVLDYGEFERLAALS